MKNGNNAVKVPVYAVITTRSGASGRRTLRLHVTCGSTRGKEWRGTDK